MFRNIETIPDPDNTDHTDIIVPGCVEKDPEECNGKYKDDLIKLKSSLLLLHMAENVINIIYRVVDNIVNHGKLRSYMIDVTW